MTKERLIAELLSFVDAMRIEQGSVFHWTNLDLRFDVDVHRRQVHVRGDMLLARMRSRFAAKLRSKIPATWSINHAIRTSDEFASWHSLRAPLTRLWRECPDHMNHPSLSTELHPEDGPVRLLASTKGASLVQALDGTAGWTFEPLGHTAWPHPWIPERKLIRGDRAAFVRSFVGTPYKTGGTTREGIDCSGLTQTIYRDALGTIIPKHGLDQYLHASSDAALPLVFLQREDVMTSHLGILLRRGRHDWSVVHASSSRGEVVEDSLDHFINIRGWNAAPQIAPV